MTRLRPIIQASLGADRRSKNRGTNIGSAVVIGVLSTGCPHLLINEREREGCVDGARRGKRWWKKTSRGPRDWKKRDKIAGNELAVCPTYLTVLLTSDLGLLGRENALSARCFTRFRHGLGEHWASRNREPWRESVRCFSSSSVCIYSLLRSDRDLAQFSL